MIVPYFEPEITAIIHLMKDLADDFERYGAEVTVVTGFPTRGADDAVRAAYALRKEERLSEHIRILRVGSRRREGRSFLVRGIRYIAKTFSFYQAARKISTDVFYIYSTPPVMGLVGALLARRAPTLYCLQDIFPDNMLAQGKLSDHSIVYKLFDAMGDLIYRKNTHIVTLSRDMKEILLQKHVDEEKISVIGNWVDTDEVRYVPRAQNPLFDMFELDRRRFYVTYCGNLGYAQDVELILDCAKLMQPLEPDIQFLIIGNGACESRIRRRILDERIGNVRMLPLQPERDSAFVYSLGDIGLVTLKPQMDRYAMPSKTWTMMSAGQPMICTADDDSELHDIIDTVQAGDVVHPGDTEALAERILKLHNNRQILEVYGFNGRHYAEVNLARSKATWQYYHLLEIIREMGCSRYVHR